MRPALAKLCSRLYSGGEHHRLVRMHEQLRDIEDLFAKYRMDRFTDTKQVDELLSKDIITPQMAGLLKEEIGVKQEAAKTARHWTRVFWYIGAPLMLLAGYNAYMLESKEWEHRREHPPSTYPFPHLHIFTKKFPWGDGTKTLFHHDNNKLRDIGEGQ